MFEVRARTFTMGLEDKYPLRDGEDGVSVISINITEENMNVVKKVMAHGCSPTEFQRNIAHWAEIDSATRVTMYYSVFSRERESTVKVKREIRHDLRRMKRVGVNVIRDEMMPVDGCDGRMWVADLTVNFRDIKVK